MVQRVDFGAEKTAIHIDVSNILKVEDTVVKYVIPISIRRRGVEMRLVLYDGENGVANTRVDAALVKAIVRGRKWFEQLASGRARSFAEIARAEGVTNRYVAHLVPLAFLAPDIVARVFSGTQPADLTTEVLTKRVDLPLAWMEQKAMLGFD